MLASSDAYGVLLPHPRWSKFTTRYFRGWKNRRCFGSEPPPGPPWRKITGLPPGLPLSSK